MPPVPRPAQVCRDVEMAVVLHVAAGEAPGHGVVEVVARGPHGSRPGGTLRARAPHAPCWTLHAEVGHTRRAPQAPSRAPRAACRAARAARRALGRALGTRAPLSPLSPASPFPSPVAPAAVTMGAAVAAVAANTPDAPRAPRRLRPPMRVQPPVVWGTASQGSQGGPPADLRGERPERWAVGPGRLQGRRPVRAPSSSPQLAFSSQSSSSPSASTGRAGRAAQAAVRVAPAPHRLGLHRGRREQRPRRHRQPSFLPPPRHGCARHAHFPQAQRARDVTAVARCCV